jgi:cytochrome c2
MFYQQIFCLHSSSLVKIKLLALILQHFSKEIDGDLHLNSQGTKVFVDCKHSHSLIKSNKNQPDAHQF